MGELVLPHYMLCVQPAFSRLRRMRMRFGPFGGGEFDSEIGEMTLDSA